MQPSSSSSSSESGGSKSVKKWGPIVAIVAVIAIIGGIVASSGGDDADPSSTEAPATTDAPVDSGAPKSDTWEYPLSFVDGQEKLTDEAFNKIAWGSRCDVELGTIAVPSFFAPACMAPFTGDNGGATAQGVTADEITIVHYQGPDDDPVIAYVTQAINSDETNAQSSETLENYIKYYETYYELYGRKVNLVTYISTGFATDEVTARADAQRIVEQYAPFVVVGGPALTNAFNDELAARKTTCMCGGGTAQYLGERDPYLWAIDGSSEQKQQLLVEYIEKQLVGKPASHAGDALKGEIRKFALTYVEGGSESKDLADLAVTRMAAIGADLALVLPYQLDPGTIQASASQIIAKLKAAGVTTVLLSTDPVAPGALTREATAQEYYPEWIVTANTLTDTNAFARSYDQAQWAHAFGLSSLAVKTNPEKIGYAVTYKWFTGQDTPSPDGIGTLIPSWELLFAGIQATGPNLTHQTLGDSFKSFETKKAITAPYLTWGDRGLWDETDYSGIDDVTLFWWDPTATGMDELSKEGTGMMQFVDGGKRYLLGEMPTEDKMFVVEGAIAMYDTAPASETPPAYPSPAG